jgi:hypothetical protein
VGRDRAVLVGTVTALLLLGVVIGVWGAFLVPLRLFGHVEGLALLVGAGAVFGAGYLGALGSGVGAVSVAPGIGWIVAVLLLGASRGGDVVLPGKLPTDPGVAVVGTAYLASGLVGMMAAALLATRRLRARASPEPPPRRNDEV